MEPQAPLRDSERANYDFFLIYLNWIAEMSYVWITKVHSFSNLCLSTPAHAQVVARLRISKC